MAKKSKKPLIRPEVFQEDDRNLDAALKGLEHKDVDCDLCKHVHKDRVTCKAFPGVIPIEIWSGDVVHTEPYPGDNGIQFELNPKIKKVGRYYQLL